MTDNLPEPPVPADCDLRDFRYMPLEVDRLRRSKAWLIAKRTPELGFYMLNLWTAAWHEVPAGSLEDDDDVLADAAMCDIKKWRRVREQVLRGWVKCSDGRLYHNVVVEKANDAWGDKWTRSDNAEGRSQRARRAANARWGRSRGTAPAETEHDLEERIGITKSNASSMREHCSDDALKGREGKGSDPNGSGRKPPDDPVKALWDRGVAILGESGRSVLGKARRQHGDLAVMRAIAACEAEHPSDPLPFFLKALEHRNGGLLPNEGVF